jgi:hypothetical protein
VVMSLSSVMSSSTIALMVDQKAASVLSDDIVSVESGLLVVFRVGQRRVLFFYRCFSCFQTCFLFVIFENID